MSHHAGSDSFLSSGADVIFNGSSDVPHLKILTLQKLAYLYDKNTCLSRPCAIKPLLGASRLLNGTLCLRAKAAALHNSRGVTSITGTLVGQHNHNSAGSPFMQGFPLFTASTQAQRISTGHSERSLANQSYQQRQSNLGEF